MTNPITAKCVENPIWSGICSLGTKGCKEQHTPNPITASRERIVRELDQKYHRQGDNGEAQLWLDAALLQHEATVKEEMARMAVERFLQWKLPHDFNPDGGITFQPEFNREYMAKQGKPPMRHEPTGTNLLTATQAKQMVEYILRTTPPTI